MTSSILNKLVIGTAQFGMDYGITNSSGKIALEEIKNILILAKKYNINTLDTAIGYGNSETSIGEANRSNIDVITKLPKCSNSERNIKKEIIENVHNSINRLRVKKLYGILLHHSKDLRNTNQLEIYNSLLCCKENNLCSKIGVSGYSSEEIFYVIKKYDIDLIQLPYNIINRELVTSGLISKLKEKNIEIHVRSIFMQGLLLLKPDKLHMYFTKWKPIFINWFNWLEKNNLTPLEACLSFVLSNEMLDKIVIGIDSIEQFKQIINISKKIDNIFPPDNLISHDTDLINPSNWKV